MRARDVPFLIEIRLRACINVIHIDVCICMYTYVRYGVRIILTDQERNKQLLNIYSLFFQVSHCAGVKKQFRQINMRFNINTDLKILATNINFDVG